MKKIHSMMLMLLVAVMSCHALKRKQPFLVVLREWPIREKISLVL